jgi:hypothetical protein
MCCHHTDFHISSAIIPPEYIELLYADNVNPDQFIVIKRSQKYDIAKPINRMNAAMQIIGLMRYLQDLANVD